MIRRPPRSTPLYSSAASDVYKRQLLRPPTVDGGLADPRPAGYLCHGHADVADLGEQFDRGPQDRLIHVRVPRATTVTTATTWAARRQHRLRLRHEDQLSIAALAVT